MLLAPSGVASIRTRDVQLVQSSHGLGITWRQYKKDQKKKKGTGKKGDIYAYKVTVRRPAAQSGKIKVGDTLLRVNGMSTAGMKVD